MTRALSAIPLTSFDARDTALFLDLDGTLLEFAERPEAARLSAATKAALTTLRDSLGGAVAIVTGRDIDSVDAVLEPLHLPVAGVHGLIRRDASGRVHDLGADPTITRVLAERLAPFTESRPGIRLERKAGTVALHYRADPEAGAACREAMREASADLGGLRLLEGKMVVEAMIRHADKGSGIAAFMEEAPFAGRLPVYAGDDVTDEDAFEAVNRLGGVSIKVGGGETAARYRVSGSRAFQAWLERLARHCGAREHA